MAVSFDSHDGIDSVSQDEWIALAESVRRELAKIIPLMNAMTPEEVNKTIQSIYDAMRLELNARTFDKDVELYLNRTSVG